jgi:hypothetical protein
MKRNLISLLREKLFGLICLNSERLVADFEGNDRKVVVQH